MAGRTFVIRLAYSLDQFHARMNEFFLLLLLAIPVALLLAGAAGLAVARRALKPLGEMTAHAQRISAHNLHDRLQTVDRSDELGQMGKVFNDLLQRLEETFTQLQRFTADAAHELRTPLAALKATGEVALQKTRSAEEYRNTLSSILEETDRLDSTIDSLLLLARAETTHSGDHQKWFPLQPLITEVIGVLEILGEDRGVRILNQASLGSGAVVVGDRSLLRLAVLNVLHNAVKFSPAGSTVRVATSVSESMPSSVETVIEDEGPGIPFESREEVFDRFYTGPTRPEGGAPGAGLGLAIAKLVVTRMGGTLHFDDARKLGARCVLSLPIQCREQ